MKRAVVLVLVACGGDAAAPDAATDPPVFELPGCPVDFDGVYIAQAVEFLPSDQGDDLDGDGDIDNLLGVLAAEVNDDLAENITAGAVVLQVLPELDVAASAPIEISAFVPSARYAEGWGPPPLPRVGVEISLGAFDASCRRRVPLDLVQSGTSITGSADRFELQAQDSVAEARDVVLNGTIAADGSALDLRSSGTFTACALHRLSFPGSPTGSALGGLVAFGIQPDLDSDDDGLERFEVAKGEIARCIDGDGTTIDGPACPCDPRITDGMSGSVYSHAVPARIMGSF